MEMRRFNLSEFVVIESMFLARFLFNALIFRISSYAVV